MNSQVNKLDFTIIDLNTKATVTFTASPDSISDKYSASYITKDIIGRSTPILIYKGGSSRTLDFTVLFHADLINEDFYTFLDRLRSMSFPVYEEGVKSPKIYMRIGKMLSFFGVLDTTITYSLPIRDGKYIRANVDFSITRIDRIREGGSFIEDATAISAWDILNKGLDRSIPPSL